VRAVNVGPLLTPLRRWFRSLRGQFSTDVDKGERMRRPAISDP
jgi:hypothetical protein